MNKNLICFEFLTPQNLGVRDWSIFHLARKLWTFEASSYSLKCQNLQRHFSTNMAMACKQASLKHELLAEKKKSRMSNQHVTMESTDMESQVLTETHAAKFHNLFPEEGVITDY